MKKSFYFIKKILKIVFKKIWEENEIESENCRKEEKSLQG